MKTQHGRLPALFILAVTLRLLYLCSTAPDAAIGSVDAWGYHRLALNLDQGHPFSLRREAPYVPDSVRTPLYPGFLWLIRRALGPAPRTAAVAQAFLDGGTVLLTWQLGAWLAGRRAGRVSALLYALNPVQVRYANELLTETLLSWLLALSACALLRYVHAARPDLWSAARLPPLSARQPTDRQRIMWLLLLAVFSGLAILCKPTAQLLPLLWLLVVGLLHRGRWRRALADASLVTLATLCLLSPWIVRNWLLFGRPFLSTALEGNVSRVSAPATLVFAQGRYVPPWSSEWESAFGQIVSQAATRYGWDKAWERLPARELEQYNHQVYLSARQVLLQHPGAWLASHAQGMLRYFEPQTYRVCYARFCGREWPPDILEDAIIHVTRQIGHAQWAKAGEIISQQRWHRLTPLQGAIWWGTFGGQIIGLYLMLRGAWKLRHHPILLTALLLAIFGLLWVPGPIAYERFRVPVMTWILALVGVSTVVQPPARPALRGARI